MRACCCIVTVCACMLLHTRTHTHTHTCSNSYVTSMLGNNFLFLFLFPLVSPLLKKRKNIFMLVLHMIHACIHTHTHTYLQQLVRDFHAGVAAFFARYRHGFDVRVCHQARTHGAETYGKKRSGKQGNDKKEER